MLKKIFVMTVLASAMTACVSNTTATPNTSKPMVKTDTTQTTSQTQAEEKKDNRPILNTKDILDNAPAQHWKDIPQENLIYMTLENGNTIIMELADSIAPEHTKQIRLLAREKFWDNTFIYRGQDNYVMQFGTFDYASGKQTKDVPASAKPNLPAEFSRPVAGLPFTALPDKEPYSDKVGFSGNFPIAVKDDQAFIPHCYGTLGVSRGMEDNVTAADLYVTIGQPARHLDRQITVAGRVIAGIEHLSTLPRGTKDPLGFYDKESDKTKIASIRVGTDVPADKQIHYQTIDTASDTFTKLMELRRNRQKGGWFVADLVHHLDVCYIKPELRVKLKG